MANQTEYIATPHFNALVSELLFTKDGKRNRFSKRELEAAHLYRLREDI